MQNNKQHYGIHVGSTSILMIFVILCLVSFATLSIVSANADYRLGKKVADRTTSYYEACNQAEESIASVDKVLKEIYETSTDQEEYYQNVGTSKEFVIPMNDLQSLEVIIEFLYPEKSDNQLYQITTWQVVITGELEYDEHLDVFE